MKAGSYYPGLTLPFPAILSVEMVGTVQPKELVLAACFKGPYSLKTSHCWSQQTMVNVKHSRRKKSLTLNSFLSCFEAKECGFS